MTTNDRRDPADVATGRKKLFPDARLGVLTNSVITVVGLAVVEWLGTIDFSTWPTIAATLAAPLTGAVGGLITSWLAKRRG